MTSQRAGRFDIDIVIADTAPRDNLERGIGLDDGPRDRNGSDNPAIDPVKQAVERGDIQHIVLNIIGESSSDHRAAMIAQQLESFFVKKARGDQDFEGH